MGTMPSRSPGHRITDPSQQRCPPTGHRIGWAVQLDSGNLVFANTGHLVPR